MKNLVFGVLGILALCVVVTIVSVIVAPAEEVERRVVETIQYEDFRTRMRDVILVTGKDLREYRIQATYELSSIARDSDRRMCEDNIANLIWEIASQNVGSTQIHRALVKGLRTFVETTKHNDTCSVRAPYISVAQTVGN